MVSLSYGADGEYDGLLRGIWPPNVVMRHTMSAARHSVSDSRQRLLRAVDLHKNEVSLKAERLGPTHQIHGPWTGKSGLDSKTQPRNQSVLDSLENLAAC